MTSISIIKPLTPFQLVLYEKAQVHANHKAEHSQVHSILPGLSLVPFQLIIYELHFSRHSQSDSMPMISLLLLFVVFTRGGENISVAMLTLAACCLFAAWLFPSLTWRFFRVWICRLAANLGWADNEVRLIMLGWELGLWSVSRKQLTPFRQIYLEAQCRRCEGEWEYICKQEQ